MNGDAPPDDCYVVASLWIRAGRGADFEAFERKALALAARHGGVLERVVRVERRPGADDPDEIHVLRFPGRDRFEAYRRDPEAAALAAEREAAIAKTVIALGRAGPAYD